MDVRTLMNYLSFVAPVLHRLGKVGETSIVDQTRIRMITNEHLGYGRLADGLGYLHHELAPGGIKQLPPEIRLNLKSSETRELSRYSLSLVPFWTRPDQVGVGLMLWKKPDVVQNNLPDNYLLLPANGCSAPPLGLHLDHTTPGNPLNHSADSETQYMTTSSIRCSWANDLSRWSLSDKDLSRLLSGGFKLYPLEGGEGPHPQGLLSDEGIRLALAAEAMGLHYLRTDLIPPTQGDHDYFSSVRDAVASLRQDGLWGVPFAYPVLALCLGVSMSGHFRDDPEHEAGIRPRMRWSGLGISDKPARDFLATQYQKTFDTTRIEETLRQLMVPTLPNRKEMIDHLRKRLERLLQACFAMEQTLPEAMRAILPNYEPPEGGSMH